MRATLFKVFELHVSDIFSKGKYQEMLLLIFEIIHFFRQNNDLSR